jgi:hypothetical protein
MKQMLLPELQQLQLRMAAVKVLKASLTLAFSFIVSLSL